MAGLIKPEQKLFSEFFDIQLIDMNDGFQTLIRQIEKKITITEASGMHSQKGASTRHSKNRKIKEFAISLYRKKNYKNPSQARNVYYAEISNYAVEIDHPFSSEYQGMQTVYKWFLQDKNSHHSK